MVDEAADALGTIDALVYCAGTAAVGPIERLTPQLWDEVYQVNTRGFGLAIQAMLPGWRAAGNGCAVVLSSQAARRAQALISAYTASKSAVEGLIRALALELAPQVRINGVAPGIVPTDMILEDFSRQAALDGSTVAEVTEHTLARIPLGRFQQASAVAEAVSFLISPAARDITGHVLAVDGGMSSLRADTDEAATRGQALRGLPLRPSGRAASGEQHLRQPQIFGNVARFVAEIEQNHVTSPPIREHVAKDFYVTQRSAQVFPELKEAPVQPQHAIGIVALGRYVYAFAADHGQPWRVVAEPARRRPLKGVPERVTADTIDLRSGSLAVRHADLVTLIDERGTRQG
jgi:NAD(P)-dependent dehydrogenase (short-subunit alcohol dehydrogenase family)